MHTMNIHIALPRGLYGKRKGFGLTTTYDRKGFGVLCAYNIHAYIHECSFYVLIHVCRTKVTGLHSMITDDE
jgi:hypothetical protein